MEFLPTIKGDIFSGWILFLIYYLTTTILMIFLPRAVVSRLYDKTGLTKKQITLSRIYKFFLLLSIIISWFSSIIVNTLVFFGGVCLFVIGEIGFISSVLTFKNTPIDEPVTQGLYKISRHPQILMNILSLLGIIFTVNSWLLFLIFLIGLFLMHFYILAEEQVCLKRYGESYKRYMAKVPKYLFFNLKSEK